MGRDSQEGQASGDPAALIPRPGEGEMGKTWAMEEKDER